MTIKSLKEILREILHEGKKNPGEWKTISAPTPDRSGSDLLLFHPQIGPIYQIRAYEKNPYKIEGMGTRISRNVDNDFLKLVENQKIRGNAGILDINFRIMQKCLAEGKKIDKIFLDALFGEKKQGLEFLNLGSSYVTKLQKPLPNITDEQKRLNNHYIKLIKRDGKNSIYG